MTARAAFTTAVSQTAEVIAEWNEATNRLRIADATTDRTLAVYSNGEVYRVMPEAPAGQVVITVGTDMPNIVRSLVAAGAIRVVKQVHDDFVGVTVTAEVLL